MPTFKKDTIALVRNLKKLEQENGIALEQLKSDEHDLERANLELKQGRNVREAKVWIESENKKIKDSRAVLKIIESESSKAQEDFNEHCKKNNVDADGAYKAIKPSFFSFPRAGVERKDDSMLFIFGLMFLFSGLFIGMMFAAPWSAGLSAFMAASLMLPLIIKLPLSIHNNVGRSKLISAGEKLTNVGGGSTSAIGMTTEKTSTMTADETDTLQQASSSKPARRWGDTRSSYNPSVTPYASSFSSSKPW